MSKPVAIKSLILAAATAVAGLILPGCSDNGSDEPHVATLYDICELASATDNSTTLYLYPQNSDEPVVLTADSSLGDNQPEAGKSIFVAYQPQGAKAYVSDKITILSWANINNIDLQIAEEKDDLEGWDKDPIEVVSSWRAGNKIYMRLRMGYDTTARRFAMVLDPETTSKPIPTAYLYHARGNSTPTFNRQYYIAFNIESLWSSTSYDGIRIIVNTDDETPTTLIFNKPGK